MELTRYEQYESYKNSLPFVLYLDIQKNQMNLSVQSNWHDDIEIQFCTKGKGKLFCGGEEYPFEEGQVAIINSNIIHNTLSTEGLNYTCLIVSSQFLKQIGFEFEKMDFKPTISDLSLSVLIEKMCRIYDSQSEHKILALHSVLLEILSLIAEKHSLPCEKRIDGEFESVKTVIRYIRENFSQKLSLEALSKLIFIDKYTLCRKFKGATGQTVMQYISRYRCQMASKYLKEGKTVASAARLCGFDNLSFFTKTFKKYMGTLPSQIKTK